MFNCPKLIALTACIATSSLGFAQNLIWGSFNTAPAFGNGSTATSQIFSVSVLGDGRGTGTAQLTLSVTGGSNAWNGFGVAGNDDGYYPAPNQPQPGITFLNGAPGYFGGIPLLSPISFATGYNLAGAPAATPAPPSDRAAIYFDAADGTTATAQWQFSSLQGGVLPAGSWLFFDNVDQGERFSIVGPSGWIASVHAGDSSLPRPPQMGVPVTVSLPSFPVCAPAINQTATTLDLLGRYGDISNPLATTCSATPVPVLMQTVGYTKGVDAVGVWVRTAIDIPSLAINIIDTDPSVRNGVGLYTGPDNNFFVGLGVIVATGPAPSIPVFSGWLGFALLIWLMCVPLLLKRRLT
jgi:hypothetical protein